MNNDESANVRRAEGPLILSTHRSRVVRIYDVVYRCIDDQRSCGFHKPKDNIFLFQQKTSLMESAIIGANT